MALQEALTGELKPLVDRLCFHFKSNGRFKRLFGATSFKIKAKCDRFDWIQATNLAAESHFSSGDDGPGISVVAEMAREVLRALKDNYLLGPHFVYRSKGAATTTAVPSLPTDSPTDSPPLQRALPPPPPPPQISAQMSMLCDILRHCGSSACILVFVDERHAARQVTAFLSEKFPQLNCQKLIGQGGFDGMQWKGAAGQGAILAAFRNGDAKLIVCTSVLEEGNMSITVRFLKDRKCRVLLRNVSTIAFQGWM